MQINWQIIIAALFLAAAVVYIVLRAKKSFSGKHDCPDCDIPQAKNAKSKKAVG